MAEAPVPASEMALRDAGITVKDLKAVKTHSPFVVNDIYMSQNDGDGCELDEQLWKLHDLRTSPGTHGRKAHC